MWVAVVALILYAALPERIVAPRRVAGPLSPTAAAATVNGAARTNGAGVSRLARSSTEDDGRRGGLEDADRAAPQAAGPSRR